jgi:hypothetical protein
MEKDKQEEIYQEFKEEVNMTPSSLKKWLETEESKSVGWDSGDGESIGHKSGEKIVELLSKKKAELTDSDYQHMQKVNGYIKRHMAQRPQDPENSNWDYSLRNWGHDFSKR